MDARADDGFPASTSMGLIKSQPKSRLGLTLQEAERPGAILTIEQIDHPTEN